MIIHFHCRSSATVTEEEIRDAFTKNGFTVKAFKFFPKDRKMALIQMPSMDDAVAALIVSHSTISFIIRLTNYTMYSVVSRTVLLKISLRNVLIFTAVFECQSKFDS